MIDRRAFIAAASAAVAATRARGADRTMSRPDGVIELRQYTLFGGRRDELISLFEENFIESQNALGAHVIGTFRDLDDPDRFVWLRGFESMPARQEALTRFYTGPVWRRFAAAANATMLDSSNVLLLRPAGGVPPDRSAGSRHGAAPGVVVVRVHDLASTDPDIFQRFFDDALRPRLAALGIAPFATFVTETSVNTFPSLPVRDDVNAFVWFARFDDELAERRAAASLGMLSGWRDAAPEAVLPALASKPELVRLQPTERSPIWPPSLP